MYVVNTIEKSQNYRRLKYKPPYMYNLENDFFLVRQNRIWCISTAYDFYSFRSYES